MITGTKTLGLALAGLAAFAWYKYSQLSAQEKEELTDNIKEKGKKFFGPLAKRKSMNGSAFDETTSYAG